MHNAFIMTMQGGRGATYRGGRSGRGVGSSRGAAQTARDQPRLSRKRPREEEVVLEAESTASEGTEEEGSFETAFNDSEEEDAAHLTLRRRNPPADASDSDPDY